MNNLYSIAFTHHHLPVESIGLLHIEELDYQTRLQSVKNHFLINELYYLSTCNRVEFTLVTSFEIENVTLFTEQIIANIFPNIEVELIHELAKNAVVNNGISVVEHMISVAASIDSMVVGEREIITQVRRAFESCKSAGLTGDKIRLIMKTVIETAKKIYSQTSISRKPVSVVSLAYHELKKYQIPLNARILVVGSGSTNTTLCRFLKKHGFKNFYVYNRTLTNAQKLADELKGKNFLLNDLSKHEYGFDVLVSCTAADHHIIDLDLYRRLLKGDSDKKLIIDLAIPQDISPEVIHENPIHYISIGHLQSLSNDNLKIRQGELSKVNAMIEASLLDFEAIFKERHVELVMRNVPEEVKKIKDTAFNHVFKNELQNLDPKSRELVEKIVGYMEKKYISGPMKKAKEILLSNVQKHEN